MTVTFAVVAVLFILISGASEGGALLATTLKLSGPRPSSGLLLLSAGVVAVPLLLGAHVANTFASRLVTLDGPHGRTAMAVAVLAALAVVTCITWTGRPTSLTLAIVGGLTGAGLGFGLEVSPGVLAYVLVVSMVAPLVGAAVAVTVSHGLARATGPNALLRVHRFGFGLQCVAYAANDGQKMLAVFAVMSGPVAAGAAVPAPLPTLVLIAALWLLGTVSAMARVGRTLGGRLVAVRPVHAVSAEIAAAGTVLGCAMTGTPVSLTQAPGAWSAPPPGTAVPACVGTSPGRSSSAGC